MIKSASFRNFKSLRQVDIDLERLTVLVGPNASGKTSILEGLYLLTQIASAEPSEVFVGRHAPRLLSRRGVTNEVIEIQCCTEDTFLSVTASPPRRASQDRPHSDAQSNPAQDHWGFGYHLMSRHQAPDPQSSYRDAQLAAHFPAAVLFRMDAARLAEPAYSDHPQPKVDADGAGASNVLALMALNQPDNSRRYNGISGP